MQLDSPAFEVAAGVATLVRFGESEAKPGAQAAVIHEDVVELVRCAVLIFCAELGDKSFFMAMLLATEHSPFIVFLGCFSALTASTLMAAFLGHVLSRWLDPVLVEMATGVLFLCFAAVLFWEWYHTPAGTEPEGLEEASEAIRMQDASREVSLEASRATTPGNTPPRVASPTRSTPLATDCAVPSNYSTASPPETFAGAFPRDAWPWWRVLGLAFMLTFVSELGDKTQVAVLAQATGHDAFLVAIGATIGFALVTAVAVAFGSRMLKLLTQRKVLLLSMLSFAIFGVLALALGALALQERANRSETGIDAAGRDEGASLLRGWRRLVEPTHRQLS